jgi:hypothetical protein
MRFFLWQLVGTLLLVGVVLLSYWWVIVTAFVAVAGFYGLQWAVRLAAKHARTAALAARAEEQHRQVMCGDDRGVYGEYRSVIT